MPEFDGRSGILFDAVTVEIKLREIVLGCGEILFDGFLIPLGGFGVILLHAAAFGVEEREVLLAGRGTLLGGFAEPGDGLFEVLVSAVAGFAGEAEGNLGFGIAFVGLNFGFVKFLGENRD